MHNGLNATQSVQSINQQVCNICDRIYELIKPLGVSLRIDYGYKVASMTMNYACLSGEDGSILFSVNLANGQFNLYATYMTKFRMLGSTNSLVICYDKSREPCTVFDIDIEKMVNTVQKLCVTLEDAEVARTVNDIKTSGKTLELIAKF